MKTGQLAGIGLVNRTDQDFACFPVSVLITS